MHRYHKKIPFILGILLFLSPIWVYADTLQIKISGLTGPALINVQERLAISQASMGEEINASSIETFLKSAEANIRTALQPFGYFNVAVEPHVFHDKNVWTVTFIIKTDRAIQITDIETRIVGPGKFNPELQLAIENFPIKKGQVFNAIEYEKAKQNLFQIANEQGYLKASFEKKLIQIDVTKNTLYIVLELNTGPRYYFGNVKFNKNTFSDDFLRRFVSFHEGDPFSSEKLIKFQQNLSGSNFFQSINVTPLLQETDSTRVPVLVDVVGNKAQRYNVGLGYGTFTGPRLTLGTSFRHLTETGHHLDLQMKLSNVLSGLAAQYVIPGQNPLTDQYTLGANAQRFVPKNGTSISKSISAGYVKTIGDWKWNATATYLRENYRIEDRPSHNSRILYPSLGFTRVSADDLINTRFGNKVDFVVRGASTHIVSNVTFLQADLKGKLIYSPTNLSRIIARSELGYTTVEDLNTLPISLQFYAGGLQTVRGFPYSYFGPGRYLKTASIELQHQLYGKISGAIFYDIGTADNHINSPMGRGTGLGLIYDSAIGPIKGYAGIGRLTGKSNHVAFEFSFGPDL